MYNNPVYKSIIACFFIKQSNKSNKFYSYSLDLNSRENIWEVIKGDN